MRYILDRSECVVGALILFIINITVKIMRLIWRIQGGRKLYVEILNVSIVNLNYLQLIPDML